jgi:hypothetical protein
MNAAEVYPSEDIGVIGAIGANEDEREVFAERRLKGRGTNLTRCTTEYRKVSRGSEWSRLSTARIGATGRTYTPFPFRYRPKQRVRLRVMLAALADAETRRGGDGETRRHGDAATERRDGADRPGDVPGPNRSLTGFHDHQPCD